MITAAALQAKAQEAPKATAEAFRKTLVDFGYTGLTQADCEKEIASFFAGAVPVGVIAMFIHGWLKEGM